MQQKNNTAADNKNIICWPAAIPKIPSEVVETALLHFQLKRAWSGLGEYLLQNHRIDISNIPVANRSNPIDLNEAPFLDITYFVILKSIKDKATVSCISSLYNQELETTSTDPIDSNRLERYKNFREKHNSESASLDVIRCQRENDKASNKVRWRIKFLVDCQVLVENESGKEKLYYPSKLLLEYLSSKTDFLKNPEL